MTKPSGKIGDSNVAASSVTTASPRERLPIEGFVDALTRNGASGWAWMPSSPQTTIEIEAVQGGKVIGRARAERPRPDLLRYNKGTGLYGFSLTFDHSLEGDEIPQLRASGLGEAAVLSGVSELPPNAKPATQRAAMAANSRDAEGHVDNLTRWGATGWAWSPKAPHLHVLVEAVVGERVIGRSRAVEPRPDLAKYGKGTGRYGFNMRFEEALQDEVPRFRVLLEAAAPLACTHDLPSSSDATSRVPQIRGTINRLLQDHSYFTAPGSEFEEFDSSILEQDGAAAPVREPLVFAFYLPQYHPIAENDRFWGKGFTEWRQMPRGLPRYPGHYQPRIPRDLGFYDLLASDALQRQVALAKSAGVNAFAYYYYWFNTKRVLERPLDALLESNVEMPFLLIWANENWTRTWDGAETSVLLRQDYREEDEPALIDDLARHFNDRRYVRLDGRPFFIIYNPTHIPEPKVTIARWRRLLKSRHDLVPIIFMAQTFGARDPDPFGLDGALEFPPHKLSDNLPGRPTPDAYSAEFTGRVIDYDEFCNSSLNEPVPRFPLIKTVVPSWDNDSRRPNRGLSLEHTSPKKYQQWLQKLLERAIAKPVFGRPMVAINAWNEWAEGAYLEPDVHYGAAYLNATARAINQATRTMRPMRMTQSSNPPTPPISVILPNYNHERFLKERIGSVLAQTHKPGEVIFLDDCSSDNSVALAEELLRGSEIPYRIVRNEQNSGGVFRQWLKGLELARHDLIWIAETDDSADAEFLARLAPYLARGEIAGAFGHIRCIDETGQVLHDLDGYFDNLLNFSWDEACVVPAYRAFKRDFVLRNVVPNASGFVFRRPRLTELERKRLVQYRFAGDWYFYALLLRGGCIAYEPEAKSYFRLNRSGTSRSAFFTDRHIEEHRMVLQDLASEYRVGDAAVRAHAEALACHFPDSESDDLLNRLTSARPRRPPLRVCIAAHSFEVGGGEILPLELANELKANGLHVTYLLMENELAAGAKSVRRRLRPDIPVVQWSDVCDDFGGFLGNFGIQLFNSHNVSVDYALYCKRIEVLLPYVSSLHGGYETVPDLLTDHFAGYLKRIVDRWLYLAPKNTTLLKAAGIDESSFRRSFNAVPAPCDALIDRLEFRRQHQIPEDAFVTYLCSRAIPEKGWRLAIEAVQLVRELSKRPVWLVLIGDGPSAIELRQIYGALDWVVFLGHVDSPSRYFGALDLGVFPSTFSGETFPMFLLECFQAGKPVVSTDIGEIPSIVGKDHRSRAGMLVSYRATRADIVYAVAAAIAGLAQNATRYEVMCANARMASKRFSMERLAQSYIELFTKLVNEAEQTAERRSVARGTKLLGVA